MSDTHHKVIVIGSGPAGLTAALYAARSGLSVLVAEGMQPGGQLTITTEVENFPGFPEGILGPELMQRTRAQAERFGAELLMDEVISIDAGSRPFTVHTANNGSRSCDALILSMGASARLLGLPSESELMGFGVSACATCDGFFFRDKEVAVVGGGDTAMEEADFLSKFASKISVIHRRDELRASQVMQERGMNNDKVAFEWNSVVTEVIGSREGGVTGVRLRDTVTGEERVLETQGLFLAIGHRPNTDVVRDVVDLDDHGYVVTVPGTTKTSVEGIWACGDVQDSVYRQAITAAGTGCMAAIEVDRWLAEAGD